MILEWWTQLVRKYYIYYYQFSNTSSLFCLLIFFDCEVKLYHRLPNNYFSLVERDPKKRRVKPIETQASLLDFDLGESSDDSDFRIEDHAEPSDDDLSMDSRDGG